MHPKNHGYFDYRKKPAEGSNWSPCQDEIMAHGLGISLVYLWGTHV